MLAFGTFWPPAKIHCQFPQRTHSALDEFESGKAEMCFEAVPVSQISCSSECECPMGGRGAGPARGRPTAVMTSAHMPSAERTRR